MSFWTKDCTSLWRTASEVCRYLDNGATRITPRIVGDLALMHYNTGTDDGQRQAAIEIAVMHPNRAAEVLRSAAYLEAGPNEIASCYDRIESYPRFWAQGEDGRHHPVILLPWQIFYYTLQVVERAENFPPGSLRQVSPYMKDFVHRYPEEAEKIQEYIPSLAYLMVSLGFRATEHQDSGAKQAASRVAKRMKLTLEWKIRAMNLDPSRHAGFKQRDNALRFIDDKLGEVSTGRDGIPLRGSDEYMHPMNLIKGAGWYTNTA